MVAVTEAQELFAPNARNETLIDPHVNPFLVRYTESCQPRPCKLGEPENPSVIRLQWPMSEGYFLAAPDWAPDASASVKLASGGPYGGGVMFSSNLQAPIKSAANGGTREGGASISQLESIVGHTTFVTIAPVAYTQHPALQHSPYVPSGIGIKGRPGAGTKLSGGLDVAGTKLPGTIKDAQQKALLPESRASSEPVAEPRAPPVGISDGDNVIETSAEGRISLDAARDRARSDSVLSRNCAANELSGPLPAGGGALSGPLLATACGGTLSDMPATAGGGALPRDGDEAPISEEAAAEQVSTVAVQARRDPSPASEHWTTQLSENHVVCAEDVVSSLPRLDVLVDSSAADGAYSASSEIPAAAVTAQYLADAHDEASTFEGTPGDDGSTRLQAMLFQEPASAQLAAGVAAQNVSATTRPLLQQSARSGASLKVFRRYTDGANSSGAAAGARGGTVTEADKQYLRSRPLSPRSKPLSPRSRPLSPRSKPMSPHTRHLIAPSVANPGGEKRRVPSSRRHSTVGFPASVALPNAASSSSSARDADGCGVAAATSLSRARRLSEGVGDMAVLPRLHGADGELAGGVSSGIGGLSSSSSARDADGCGVAAATSLSRPRRSSEGVGDVAVLPRLHGAGGELAGGVSSGMGSRWSASRPTTAMPRPLEAEYRRPTTAMSTRGLPLRSASQRVGLVNGTLLAPALLNSPLLQSPAISRPVRLRTPSQHLQPMWVNPSIHGTSYAAPAAAAAAGRPVATLPASSRSDGALAGTIPPIADAVVAGAAVAAPESKALAPLALPLRAPVTGPLLAGATAPEAAPVAPPSTHQVVAAHHLARADILQQQSSEAVASLQRSDRIVAGITADITAKLQARIRDAFARVEAGFLGSPLATVAPSFADSPMLLLGSPQISPKQRTRTELALPLSPGERSAAGGWTMPDSAWEPQAAASDMASAPAAVEEHVSLISPSELDHATVLQRAVTPGGTSYRLKPGPLIGLRSRSGYRAAAVGGALLEPLPHVREGEDDAAAADDNVDAAAAGGGSDSAAANGGNDGVDTTAAGCGGDGADAAEQSGEFTVPTLAPGIVAEAEAGSPPQ